MVTKSIPATSSPATASPALPTTRPRLAAETSMIDAIAALVSNATPFFSSSAGCLMKDCIAGSGPAARRPPRSAPAIDDKAEQEDGQDDRPREPGAADDGEEHCLAIALAGVAAQPGPGPDRDGTGHPDQKEQLPAHRARRCRRRTRRLMCN